MTFLSIIFALLTSTPLYGQADACDDYIARHHKRDLKPISLTFQEKKYSGDIYFPHQQVHVKIKNVGQETLGSAPQVRNMTIQLGLSLKDAGIVVPIPSKGIKYAAFQLKPGTLKHCKKYFVRIDYKRNVGQWGCNVFNNDHAVIQAYEAGKFCRVIRPFR